MPLPIALTAILAGPGPGFMAAAAGSLGWKEVLELAVPCPAEQIAPPPSPQHCWLFYSPTAGSDIPPGRPFRDSLLYGENEGNS